MVAWIACAVAVSLIAVAEKDMAIRKLPANAVVASTSTPVHRNPVRILFYGRSITKQEWSQQGAQDIRKAAAGWVARPAAPDLCTPYRGRMDNRVGQMLCPKIEQDSKGEEHGIQVSEIDKVRLTNHAIFAFFFLLAG